MGNRTLKTLILEHGLPILVKLVGERWSPTYTVVAESVNQPGSFICESSSGGVSSIAGKSTNYELAKVECEFYATISAETPDSPFILSGENAPAFLQKMIGSGKTFRVKLIEEEPSNDVAAEEQENVQG